MSIKEAYVIREMALYLLIENERVVKACSSLMSTILLSGMPTHILHSIRDLELEEVSVITFQKHYEEMPYRSSLQVLNSTDEK
jgi:hypothetical protein